MHPLMIIGLILTVILFLWVMGPLFAVSHSYRSLAFLNLFGSNLDPLDESSVVDDRRVLEERLQFLVQQFARDFRLFSDGQLTEAEWSKRKSYLEDRYVDAKKRHHWLRQGGVS
jgi:hypothetical protein